MKKEMIKELESHGIKAYGNQVMIDETLYPLPLVQGNEKLGKKVWHSSTLPTNGIITATDNDGNEICERGTCPINCKGCYGTTNNYRYNSVKYVLIMRTRLLKNYPQIYFMLVALQLKYENIEKLRIHAVGDFIKGEALGFYNVLKQFPNVKAWTYTKVKENDEIRMLNSLDNCNIVKSIIPHCGFNFGHVPYIASVYYRLKRENKSVYICKCGIDKSQHCSDCNGCSEHEYVLFIEHSTGYNAETDYGYEKIVSLINNQ